MSALIANTHVRYAVCLVVLTLSLLLLGAGRVSGERKVLSRRAGNIAVCRETARLYTDALPASQRDAWRELLRNNPELAVRSGTNRLHEIRSGK